jgi:hypothetical protein
MVRRLIENLLLWTVTFASAWTLISHGEKTEDAVSSEGKKPVAYERCAGESLARTELLFGRSRPDGSTITAEEFGRFIDDAVLPWFPDGLTGLVDGDQVRGSGGPMIRQNSVFLVLLYPVGDDDSGAYIEKIRDAYNTTFEQNSVMRVDSESCVSF